MKKLIILTLVAMITPLLACAQTSNQKNGHEYVDLGLPSGTKWATCNVGANKSTDYGDYYAYGTLKTKEKSPFSRERQGDKWIDGKKAMNITANPQYDVATNLWGEGWQIPTKEQMEELNSKCKWSWTTKNGVKGYKVTGPNGNSIFLPASGFDSCLFTIGRFELERVGHSSYYRTSTYTGGIMPFSLFCGEVLNEMDGIYERPIHRIDGTMDNGNLDDFLMSIRPVTK